MIQEQIKSSIKDAMRAKDDVRLRTLRGMLATFTNELVAKKQKPDGMLSDEDALTVIRRLVKQRKDSIEQFEKGGRQDLVAEEQAELSILETYLPQMMSDEEIRKIVEAKKEELGIVDKIKKGLLVGAVMKDLKGKANGDDVMRIVETVFSGVEALLP